MGIMDSLDFMDVIKGLKWKTPDGGEGECSDWLVLALGLIVGGVIYLCKDKIAEIIRAAKEKGATINEEKMAEIIRVAKEKGATINEEMIAEIIRIAKEQGASIDEEKLRVIMKKYGYI